jgi:putative transposase
MATCSGVGLILYWNVIIMEAIISLNVVDYTKGNRSVYSLNIHLVLVTKYRRKVITEDILRRLKEVFDATCQKWRCTLKEFNGEADHVHLVISFPPDVQVSTLVGNLKTVSSRLIRKEFADWISQFYKKPVFWSGAYFVASCGGVTLDHLKRYVEQQSAPRAT